MDRSNHRVGKLNQSPRVRPRYQELMPYTQKRKRTSKDTTSNGAASRAASGAAPGARATSSNSVDTSKPTAVFKSTTPRTWTISMAVPGSIIANALTHDLKTALASTIARCTAVFSIDEIIIFDDGTIPPSAASSHHPNPYEGADAKSGYTAFRDPCHFLVHVLTYLETPPYLRRALFGFHPNLRTAGACPSLDMPHHAREGDGLRWREGATVDDGAPAIDDETLVNAGMGTPVTIPVKLPPAVRVTLDFGSEGQACDRTRAEAVSPSAPREEGGYYWGFSIRRADSLSAVFTEAPQDFENGYDYCIGTSERGQPLPSFLSNYRAAHPKPERGFEHLLLVFGGVAGLEAAVANDATLRERAVTEAKDVFDAWVDLVPGQGSRTIRTEEAVWAGCMGLRSLWANEP